MSKEESTIEKMYGVSPKPLMLEDNNYKLGTLSIAAPDLVVGLELEIENWEPTPVNHNGQEAQDDREEDNEDEDDTDFEPKSKYSFNGFNFHADNSLRGSSIEAVTLPTKSKYIEALLTDFYNHFKITANNYSERTGTHVHVDISNLTPSQLASFCQLYQVFEILLFKYAGADRDNNIFCVPWHQANISVDVCHYIRNSLKEIGRSWRKYTALNLVPILSQGSVEFRHLSGTCDVKFLVGWINLIGRMYNYATNVPYSVLLNYISELNTSSSYRVFLEEVFKADCNLLDTSQLPLDMETGVINVKLMAMSELSKVVDKSTTKMKFNNMQWPEYNDEFVEDRLRLAERAAALRDAAQVPGWGQVGNTQAQPNPTVREQLRQAAVRQAAFEQQRVDFLNVVARNPVRPRIT